MPYAVIFVYNKITTNFQGENEEDKISEVGGSVIKVQSNLGTYHAYIQVCWDFQNNLRITTVCSRNIESFEFALNTLVTKYGIPDSIHSDQENSILIIARSIDKRLKDTVWSL